MQLQVPNALYKHLPLYVGEKGIRESDDKTLLIDILRFNSFS